MTTYLASGLAQQVQITLGTTAASSNTMPLNTTGTGRIVLFDGVNCSTNGNPARDFLRIAPNGTNFVIANRNTAGGTAYATGCIIDADTSGLVASPPQYVTVTIADTASSGTTSISAVVDANTAIHLLGWTSANTTINAPDEYPQLSLSGTTLTATRIGTTGQLVVGAVIIEFQGSALASPVQRISATSSANSTSYTAAISSVNTNNTICVYAGSNIATSTTLNLVKMYGTLTNATTFTVNVNTAVGNAKTYNVCIVEFVSGVLRSNVQRNTTTLTGVASSTTSITTVDETYSGFSWLGNTYSAANTTTTRSEGAGLLDNDQIHVLQSTFGNTGSATSFNVTLDFTATAGNTLAVVFGGRGTGRAVTGVTDNQLQTYTQVPSVQASDSTGTGFTDIWYFSNTVAGVTKITVTISGAAGYAGASVYELTNAAASPIDAVAVVNNGASSTTLVTGAISTAQANEFIIAEVMPSTGGANSVATPYLLGENALNLDAYHKTSSTVSGETATFTLSSAHTYCASSVAIKAANSTVSEFVTVSKNNATANLTGSWEIFEFSTGAAPATIFPYWQYASQKVIGG